ncbi:TPA: hypothetical protein R1763_001557, partial [Campylobacter lari]|nr:hypothetical protein [Campylobacter lari]
SVKELTIKFSYMKTGVSKAEFTADKIKLYQRELKFEGDRTIYTEENTQANITLKGGKKGAKVEWSLKDGDATLGSHDTTFNRSGYAYATITSKAPFKANPVISVETIGQSVSTTIAYVDKEYIPSIVYPNYKGHEKTVNLNQDFNLEVSNLIPNTEIEIYHNFLSIAQPKQDHVKVNSSGKATLEFYGVWTSKTDKFNIKFKYMKTKNKSADFSTDWIYVYKQDIKLVLDIDKDSFLKREGEEAHAILKAGKANEKVEWSLSGDATLTKSDKVFNASGEAKATITSKAPFKDNPIISVNTLGQRLSQTITYSGETTLVLDIDKNSLNAQEGEEAHAILKGGKANEKIEWSLSGDATLTKADKVFNASGEAKATITSKAPFKDNPVISVNAMGKNLSKELNYKKIPIQLILSKTKLNPQIIEVVNIIARGTPNAKIKWSIVGDGVLPKEDLIPKYFDSKGVALTKFRTIDPNTRPVTVSVEYEDGSEKASKTAVFDG